MDYIFNWYTCSTAGDVTGKYEQTIYGETLEIAVATFVSMHGSLAPDEDSEDDAIIITLICAR